MSSLFKATVIKGNRLTEFSQTTATVGTVKPFGYGRFTVPGNVGWAPLPPKEHVTKKRQGKGGVKQETYTYTLSYAVMACRGPIYGFWWIKRNGKVVWTQDPDAPVEDKDYAAKWAQKATFYFGGEDQLPDSTIESYEGTGQVSAFMDDAFFVVEDDDVTAEGGAVPNYEACVIANGVGYVTSEPYVVEVGPDSYERTGVLLFGELRDIIDEADAGIDSYDRTGALLDGVLRSLVQQYTMQPDGYDRTGTLLDGVLDTVVIPYTMQPDGYDRTGTLQDGTMEQIVIEYTSPQEQYRRTGTLLNGTLT